MKQKRIIFNSLVIIALLVINISCSYNHQTVSDSTILKYEKQLEKNQNEMFERFEKFKPSSLPTKNLLSDHYEKYKRKFRDVGLQSLRMIPIFYSSRVNLDKISKYKKYGIEIFDLDKQNFLTRHGWNFYTAALFSPVIIVGTVVDTVSYDFDNERIMIYTTRVDKFYKGSDHLITPPEYVKIYHLEGFYRNGVLGRKIGGPTYSCEINKSYLLNLRSAITQKNSIRCQQSNNEAIENEVRNHLEELCKPTSFRITNSVKITNNIDLTYKNIEEIEKLNDTINFYSRDP